jgi:hypothetical protein
MIQICSLDFLRKETFDTDIMTVDGRILCTKGDKVTPELILKLYFKEVYAKNVQIEEICSMPQATSTAVEQEIIEAVQIKEQTDEVEKPTEEVKEIEAAEETKALEIVEVSELAVKTEDEASGTKTKAGPRVLETVENEQASGKDPRVTGSSIDDDISEESSKAKLANEAQFTLAEKSIETARLTAEKEALLKDPNLEFDEIQAKRIVEHSLAIGKIFNFTPAELKDLELVAYNCNIGITEFKKSDMAKKDFRKMKAYASYKKLQKEETVQPKIAEMVKFTATSHASDSVILNSKMPIDNIVGIVSYYEDSLNQNVSKEETLLKMLQLGGNHFNIFILHKFIKMMRDTNG